MYIRRKGYVGVYSRVATSDYRPTLTSSIIFQLIKEGVEFETDLQRGVSHFR